MIFDGHHRSVRTFGMSMMAECGGGGPKSLLMQRSCFQKRDASARRKRAEGEKASSRLAWLIEGEYINYVLGKRSTGAGRGTARVAQFYQHESSSRRRECGPSVYFLLWNSRRVAAASRCMKTKNAMTGGETGDVGGVKRRTTTDARRRPARLLVDNVG